MNSEAKKRPLDPHWFDHCEHVSRGDGIFIDTVIDFDGELVDVYIWKGQLKHPEICTRYGNEGSEYSSIYGSVDMFIDPTRMIREPNGQDVRFSKYYGAEIEAIRAWIAQNPEQYNEFKKNASK